MTEVSIILCREFLRNVKTNVPLLLPGVEVKKCFFFCRIMAHLKNNFDDD